MVVMQICHKENLKLNKNKCHFKCTTVPVFGEIISRYGFCLDPCKLNVLTDMLPPNSKEELQSFLGIMNYQGKFSPYTTETCEPLRKLTSNKDEWTWYSTYQKLCKLAKSIIKADVSMKFSNEKEPLYLETDE